MPPRTVGAHPEPTDAAAVPVAWRDVPLARVLCACGGGLAGPRADTAEHALAAGPGLLVVDSDRDRLRLLELHRAVALHQPATRWRQWWNADARDWLDELIDAGALSPAAGGYWRAHRRRLQRGLGAVELPSQIGWLQRRLLAALLLPRRPMARLLEISDRVRRSGRFLDLWGRRRIRSMIGLWLAAGLLRLTGTAGGEAGRVAALRLARRWRGQLTTRLLACDPIWDERLRRWWRLPAAPSHGLPAVGGGSGTDEGDAAMAEVRRRWAEVTLIPCGRLPSLSAAGPLQALEGD